MLEGGTVIQRYLHRLERWVHVKLIQFSKAKLKVLHLGQRIPNMNTGWGISSPMEKDLEILEGTKQG